MLFQVEVTGEGDLQEQHLPLDSCLNISLSELLGEAARRQAPLCSLGPELLLVWFA